MQRIQGIFCQTKICDVGSHAGHYARQLKVCVNVIRAILFDAAGTLFFLTKTVGDHYAYVGRVFDQVAPSLSELDRDNFFEVAYEHFAEPGVWQLYPEVPGVLEELLPRFQLAVISNFDGRLRLILQHLGISKFFAHIFISSELGADKPDLEIFRRAVTIMHLHANQVLHVGDDPRRDWKASRAAGLSIFRLDRRRNSLRDLLNTLHTNRHE